MAEFDRARRRRRALSIVAFRRETFCADDFTVITAASGGEADHVLRGVSRPDVVLLDVAPRHERLRCAPPRPPATP